MTSLSAEVLQYTSEAALLIQRGKVSFANTAAVEILGECVGQTVRSLFGPEVAGTQAATFAADVPMYGKHCIVRVSKLEKAQVVFFYLSDEQPKIITEPFIYSLRSSLMTMDLALSQLRSIAAKSDDESIKASANSLTRTCYRIMRITTNASVMLHMSDKTIMFDARMINISELFAATVDTIRPLVPNISFNTDFGNNISVVADPELAKQMYMNLITNCIVHAKGASKVSINVFDTPDSVVLSVSDDGCGMAPDMLLKAFEKHRASPDFKNMNNGAGLGLYVSRHIVQLHGGTMLIESRVDQGTTVRVSFAKRRDGKLGMHSPQPEYGDNQRELLIAFSDFLPDSCYSSLSVRPKSLA